MKRMSVDVVVIGGSLRIGWRWGADEVGFDHVGEDGARLGEIESGEDWIRGLIHDQLPKIHAAPRVLGAGQRSVEQGQGGGSLAVAVAAGCGCKLLHDVAPMKLSARILAKTGS